MNSPFLAKHDPNSCVAFGGGGPRTAEQLLQDAARVQAALPAPDGERRLLMVFKSDRYAFAVALLAAWAGGHTVALPPNQRGETVTELLDRSDIAGLLHDTEVGGHYSIPRLLNDSPTPALSSPFLLPVGLAAVLLTSGTSGRSESWPKTGEQLLTEARSLARHFALQPGARFVATVPPTHLYGLLFGVLIPLVSGGAFCRDTPLHAEAIGARVNEFEANVLVSVPAHLRAARALSAGNLAPLRRVFSSTAPLTGETARRFLEQHGAPITEIFGSTETGGIAWRQLDQQPNWAPLPGVRLETDGEEVLRVDSPWLHPQAARPFVTADRVQLNADGTFVHLGRLDGVIKVAGLRVSLPAMEDWLLAQHGVQDCVVLAVPEPARGTKVLAALVAEGWNEARLRQLMAQHFEPATLPKRVLFVDRLPREANGKLQRHRALRLFGLDPEGRPMTRKLEIRDERCVHEAAFDRVTATVLVPLDYLWYTGHFDSYPVMAGVVQLHELLLPVVARHRPDWGPLEKLHRVKFLGRIAPGDTLTLCLKLHRDSSRCEFSLERDGASCSAGSLDFAAHAVTTSPSLA